VRPFLTLGFVAGALTAVTAAAANAAISVAEAQYAGGVLVVRGHVSQAGQTVKLNKLYTETSDNGGRFTFRIRYLPQNCKINLKSGVEEYSVMVANCRIGKPVTTKPALRD
jgi:hypothetical protein